MPKFPYMEFYTGDWIKDPQLSMCAPSTRGIWIDFLCCMHELDQCGVIAGTRDQLSRLGRCSLVQLDQALSELSTFKAADVTERNGIVTLVNRRMKRKAKERCDNALRVAKHREKRRCNGAVMLTRAEYSSSSSSSKAASAAKSAGARGEKNPEAWNFNRPLSVEQVIAEAEKIGYAMTRQTAEKFLASYSATAEPGTGIWKRGRAIVSDWRKLLPIWKVNEGSSRKEPSGGDLSKPKREGEFFKDGDDYGKF